MTYDEQGNQVTKIRKSNTGMFTQLISDARAAEWELIGPEDEPRLFYKMPWWKKVIVMAGGPSVNIAIAFFLFWGVFAFYGNPSGPRSRRRPAGDQRGQRLRHPLRRAARDLHGQPTRSARPRRPGSSPAT